MNRMSRIVLALALCGVVCCTPPPLVAGPLPVASTVLDALTAPDGARVQLNGVSVAFTGPDASVLVVFDPWSRDLRLPVLTSGYVDVANGQTVAVTGSMTTLRGGLRAVAKPEIRPYLDSAGRPIPFPLPPAMAAELPAWRVGPPLWGDDLFAVSAQSLETLDINPPPGGAQGGSSATDPLPGSVAWAKARPDGARLSLYEMLVSCVFPASEYYYVQQPGAASGMRVLLGPGEPLPVRGNPVHLVDYQIETASDGERQLRPLSAEEYFWSSSVVPVAERVAPLHMDSRALWGAAANAYTPGPVYAGNPPIAGTGVPTTGLYVHVAGAVSYVGDDYFYLSDPAPTLEGPVPLDDVGQTGIRVAAGDGPLPGVGDYVNVVGIAGLRPVGQDRFPVVRRESCLPVAWANATEMFGIPCAAAEYRIAAVVTQCGTSLAGKPIQFTGGANDIFIESGTSTAVVETDVSGRAVVTYKPDASGPPGASTTSLTVQAPGQDAIEPEYTRTSGTLELAAGIDRYLVFGEWTELVVRARFRNGSTVAPAQQLPLALELTNGVFGNGSPTILARTDANGELRAVVRVLDNIECEATAVLTVTATDPCTAAPVSVQRFLEARCFWNQWDRLNIFLCLDATGSMASDYDKNPQESLKRLIADLRNHNRPFRLAGVKFNDLGHIQPSETRSLSTYTSSERFEELFIDNYDEQAGGDDPELQLDALMIAAQDFATHAPVWAGNQNIAILVTDQTYHYRGDGSTSGETSPYLPEEVTQALSAAGAATFIAVWDELYCTDCEIGGFDCDMAWDYADLGTLECTSFIPCREVSYPFDNLRSLVGLPLVADYCSGD